MNPNAFGQTGVIVGMLAKPENFRDRTITRGWTGEEEGSEMASL